MGADLILQSLPAFQESPERNAKMKAIIDGLTMDDFGEEVSDRYETLEERKDAVRMAYDEAANCVGRRDCGELQFPGMTSPYWVTGGMSWGDDPTDLCDTFSILNDTDIVYRKILEWSTEDHKPTCVM